MARPSASDDDAALRWDDLDDPSYSDPSLAALAPEPADDDAAGAGSATADGAAAGVGAAPGLERASDARSPLATLLTALAAVVYLAYTVGWIIGIGLVPLSGPTLVIEIMYQFSEFLAIIAAPLWFAAVVSLTREGRAAHRFGWLALGALVLVPWPFVLGLLR
ncbi:hypothetical protein [Microcella sp.]|uniref:hypothetical protein n=1 Tax=Microcella sp. TaxID=1913979 RepID=UPI002565A3DD|nr:hypothetical protein [Microcella sp.]MBX9472812.1 hypothetical protein [Microcella sp.]